MAVKKTKKKNIKEPVKKTKKVLDKKPIKKTKTKIAKKRKITAGKDVAKKISKKPKPKPKKKRKLTTRTLVLKKLASKTSEEERKITLRRFLINKREEIVREAKTEISKYIKGETKQIVDTALDDGDWAVVDLSEDISLKQLNTHRENLLKIDESLRKLEEGTYGRCEECGEEISEERLKVLPFAIYCRDCQEKREQLEEMEKKEGIG